jgi:hypothetical protein
METCHECTLCLRFTFGKGVEHIHSKELRFGQKELRGQQSSCFSVPRSAPYGSTPSLLVEIPQYFVRTVSFRDQANTLVNALLGFNGPDVSETMRRSLFNLFTAYHLCCRTDSPIPFSQWPRHLFVSYLAPSRLILSLPDHELLTKYVESILIIFLQKLGGFAVPLDCRDSHLTS